MLVAITKRDLTVLLLSLYVVCYLELCFLELAFRADQVLGELHARDVVADALWISVLDWQRLNDLLVAGFEEALLFGDASPCSFFIFSVVNIGILLL